VITWIGSLGFWYLVLAALTCGLQRLSGHRGPRALPWVAGMVAWVPVNGLPLARWLYGFSANFSVVTAAFLLNVVWTSWRGRPLLAVSARRSLWLFAVLSGLVLYPAALGWGSVDTYGWGWGRPPLLAWGVAALTFVWVLRGQSGGWVLLAACVAYHAGALESTNLWDYVVDPILFLIGLIVWTVRLIRLCALPTARASRNAMPAGEGGSVPE
jgi:hypothetical protein